MWFLFELLCLFQGEGWSYRVPEPQWAVDHQLSSSSGSKESEPKSEAAMLTAEESTATASAVKRPRMCDDE
jgi:hypothetical protein